jgi:hypothetical protein
MVITARPDDEPLTGSGPIESWLLPIAVSQTLEAQTLCRPMHVPIIPIYFNLRPEAYFRPPSPTPSRMHIHGIGAETDFLERPCLVGSERAAVSVGICAGRGHSDSRDEGLCQLHGALPPQKATSGHTPAWARRWKRLLNPDL